MNKLFKIYKSCYFIMLFGIVLFIISLLLGDNYKDIVGMISAGIIFIPIFIAFIVFLLNRIKK